MGYDWFVGIFQVFLIVFVRILGMFLTAPFFSGSALTFRFKLALGFFVGLIAAPLVIGMGVKAPASFTEYGVLLLVNFVLGVGIGFFAYIIVQAFQAGAEIFSIQMGLGMNEVFDPVTETQSPAMGNILSILLLMLIVRLDGHFFLIDSVVRSFKSVNAIDYNTAGVFVKGFLSAVIVMLETAVRIALPVIAVTIILDLAMGIISCVAPQFNVMIMGINLKLLAGFAALWLLITPLVELGTAFIGNLIKNLNELVFYLGKGGAA